MLYKIQCNFIGICSIERYNLKETLEQFMMKTTSEMRNLL